MEIGVMLPVGEGDASDLVPTWPEIRSLAVAAEEAGLDSVWVPDHFFYAPPDGPIQGMHEGWTTLVAVVAATQRVKVGSLVLCSSFRHAGLVAKMAVTADEVGGGRLILGFGAGWHDAEYEAFGFPTDRRVDRFDEALRVVRALLDGETVGSRGGFLSLADAVLRPSPARRIPLLVAGEGPRMLRLAAQHADAWNTAWYGAPDQRLRSQLAAFAEALAASGRDPGAVARTVGVQVAGPHARPDRVEERMVGGSVDDLARVLDAYEALGLDHVIVGLEPITETSLQHLRSAMALRG